LAIFTLKGEAVALGRAMMSAQEILDLKHGVVASLERVLMIRGTYPKVWKSGKGNETEQK
jgi:H/ACA ribonucleoprotein complex subunit 4